ncbi:unnamed protein product [Chilo suppressalis]|uniref:G-protein coupled receptors family 1 profile domain-containing protein n=1 Tax=Chilo suppressalis TaxID=168631 RepID=A0ABN8AU54_CHISP|nr:unnamed protein product [Chilo suppressalis]
MYGNVSEVSQLIVENNFWDYFNMESSDNVTDGGIKKICESNGCPVCSVLLVAGAIGNVAVFASLLRSRRRKSRVNLLMTHLVVADMMVTFIVIPLESKVNLLTTYQVIADMMVTFIVIPLEVNSFSELERFMKSRRRKSRV